MKNEFQAGTDAQSSTEADNSTSASVVSKPNVRRSTGLTLGIYTPIEWHNMSKPSLKDKPYTYCWVCRKNYKSDYNKWYNKKQKILQGVV
jgi:hypothetical protein